MANETKYFKTPFAESGTRTEVPNTSVGGLVAFNTGFGPDYELPQGAAGRKRIERDKYNGMLFDVTKNLKRWQEGLYPTWIEDNGSGVAYSYPQGMVVNHSGEDWYSNEAANQEEPGTGLKWTIYTTALASLQKPSTSIINEVITGVFRDLQSRSLDTLSILDFGGKDDDDGSLTTTNNLMAFASYFAYLNSVGGGKMYLPKTVTGGYFINGDDPTPATSPIEIVADEGVYIRIISSGGTTNSPLANNNVKSNRQILKIQQNFGFSNYTQQNTGALASSNLSNITQGQGVYSEPRTLVGNNFVVIDLADPSNTITPITTVSDSISFSGTGKDIAAVKAARVGDETFALISNPTAGIFFAGVLTANGHSYYSQNSGTQAVMLVDSTAGLSPLVTGVQYTLMNQQRDLFNNSLLSVRIISSRKYSVLCNGLVIGTYNTRSNITGAMFGTSQINGTTSVSQFSSVITNSKGGSKPLRIVALGDSISDNDVQYSPYRLMSSILQSQGLQLAELNNLSKAGELAGQQYVRLQTIGVGYDYCLVQIGVNDIQGSTSFASFSQTIIDICTYAKSVGMTPIVGIPTQFYSLAEANANGQTGGQNTANNQIGYTYRALLIRAVASVGGLINLQSIKNQGALTASWLSANVTGVQTDSMLVDNIHPTPYAAMMLGLGWSESVLGALHRLDDSESQPFESVPTNWMRNGFGVTSRPTIKVFKLAGKVHFDGATSPEGNPFMQLPKHLRPTEVKVKAVTCFAASGLPSGVASLYIGVDGNCYGFNIPALTVSLSLDAVDLSDVAFV